MLHGVTYIIEDSAVFAMLYVALMQKYFAGGDATHACSYVYSL